MKDVNISMLACLIDHHFNNKRYKMKPVALSFKADIEKGGVH